MIAFLLLLDLNIIWPMTNRHIIDLFLSHDVIFVLSCKFWWRFFFFLFFQVVMALHLYLLISAYIKFPKKTSLELGFSNLVLPAVTICNVNTFKYSFRYQTPPRMQRFLDKIDPTQYYSQVSMYYSIFIMHKQTSYQAEIYSSMADIHKLRFF